VCRQYILKENISQQKQRYDKEYNKLNAKIDRLEQIGTSLWSDYQDDYVKNNNNSDKTTRFNELSDMLKGIDISQSLEIGGNRGAFSKLLLERNIVQRAIVTDYDRFAIDKCFLDNFSNGRDKAREDIYCALVNVMDAAEKGNSPRHERLKSDVVIAMALTHHLILSQDISPKFIFETLAKYTSKYILIEFMPLGLWYKKSKEEPNVPDWYTLDWFKKEMSIKFDIISEKQTDINRIALLGKLK
jgi:hypothetical protein